MLYRLNKVVIMNLQFKDFSIFFFILGLFQIINCQIIFPDDVDNVDTSSRFTQTYGQCTTPNRRSGTCIKIRQCRNLWQLIEKQVSYQLSYAELVFLRNSQCGEQDGVLVCCESNQIQPDAPTPATRPPPARATNRPTRRPQVSSLLPTSDQCANSATRIYGGRETDLGEFPWMALIEYTKNVGAPGHHCGGSLINNRYVLTAAHCIKKISKDWHLNAVRLGEHDIETNPDCSYDINNNEECAPAHIDVPVEKFVVHENYNPNSKTQVNDIALLRLSTPVTYSRYIQPICLPISNYLNNLNLTGIALEVAGWGRTENGYPSTKKLKALINAVSLPSCNSVYSNKNVILEENQLCAGGAEGIDSCNGDSGGPLIGVDTSTKKHYYYLAGLVSFGPNPCGLKGWPGVYTRIAPYVDWIQQNIEP